jgi:hypothetical protein
VWLDRCPRGVRVRGDLQCKQAERRQRIAERRQRIDNLFYIVGIAIVAVAVFGFLGFD